MELIWRELTYGIPTSHELAVILVRLAAAAAFGAAIGIERETAGKAAGVRTHMLVTVGTTLFLLACGAYKMNPDGYSRVIQGIVTGIGFIGAGTIIKLEGEREVKGLTSAAGIWMASAIGVAVGLGAIGLAAMATALSIFILKVTIAVDKWINRSIKARKDERTEHE